MTPDDRPAGLFAEGMGTENSGPLIAALVTLIRPRRIIEIGSGDSTLAIAASIERAVAEHGRDGDILDSGVRSQRRSVLAPGHARGEYLPRFWSYDDGSGAGSTQASVERHFRGQGERFGFVELVNANFFDVPAPVLDENGPFDFAWVDAGSLIDDARFLHVLWPRIAAGGILALHDPYWPSMVDHDDDTQSLESVPSPLWQAIMHSHPDDVEVFTLPERHKYRQTGVGLIRKRLSLEAPRESEFTEEMVAMTDAPVRFASLGFAVGSGADSVAELGRRLPMPARAIAGCLTRLFALGMLAKQDERIVVDDEQWTRFLGLSKKAPRSPRPKFFTADRPAFLRIIADQLSADRWAPESHVNELCSVFDDDFATLRRELVDKGYLERADTTATYRRRRGPR
jgi:predicted O-methyltransferase YrrM